MIERIFGETKFLAGYELLVSQRAKVLARYGYKETGRVKVVSSGRKTVTITMVKSI